MTLLKADTDVYPIYTARNPRKNQYYRCVEAHFEELERIWEERYQRTYGFWRQYVTDVIYKYLDCGDLHVGFARVKCNECNHEYLLPFSCKRRHFCPTCHQKRVLEFGEFLNNEVLKEVPHRQWVFSLPKRLRVYFLFDRKLLVKLSQCAWKVLSRYLEQSVSSGNPIPAAVIAVQTFGDLLNFNPHLHIIAPDGCFDAEGNFMQGAAPQASELEGLFRAEVLKMLKREKKINDAVIENMDSWHHSGFHVYCGNSIMCDDQEGMERLAQYIIRAPISQERMQYISVSESIARLAQVIYTGKKDKNQERFDALDWLARLVTHIPNKGEQLVRYYGYYSNRTRGICKKAALKLQKDESFGLEDSETSIQPSTISRNSFRKKWASLIQKVYHIDPLLCPKCNGKMRIISFIDDKPIIRKILIHLNLWMTGNHDPPEPSRSAPLDYPTLKTEDLYENPFKTTIENTTLQIPYEDEFSQESLYAFEYDYS